MNIASTFFRFIYHPAKLRKKTSQLKPLYARHKHMAPQLQSILPLSCFDSNQI
nr:MAG TPA: hypothetical protein [Caudoviricetes sp.]